MDILSTIVPIFILIGLGWFVRRKGFIPPEFFGPANRLVFYLAIPAMIFRAISKSSINLHFQGDVLFITLSAAFFGYMTAWLICRGRRMRPGRAGTFVQSAGHGNLGYIGLSVSFYLLGDEGLVRAGIIAGFLMILQNFLSVLALSVPALKDRTLAGNAESRIKGPAAKVLGNPVIISAMAGIVFSFFQIPVPLIFQRSLDMLGGLAMPTGLLLIGGSLSVRLLQKHYRPVMGAVMIKLIMLPACGLILFHGFHISPEDYMPGLILLASPTATVTYVMAKELNGDPEFAVAAISASTLLSAGTFGFWLMIGSHMS